MCVFFLCLSCAAILTRRKRHLRPGKGKEVYCIVKGSLWILYSLGKVAGSFPPYTLSTFSCFFFFFSFCYGCKKTTTICLMSEKGTLSLIQFRQFLSLPLKKMRETCFKNLPEKVVNIRKSCTGLILSHFERKIGANLFVYTFYTS